MNKCAFIRPENYIITPTTITFKGCKNRDGEDFASGMKHPTPNNVVIPDGFEHLKFLPPKFAITLNQKIYYNRTTK